MSEAGNHTDPEPPAEKSIFEPLLRVKGVLIASMVLAVCVSALDLPFWFRAGLLAVVVLGAVWLSSEVAGSEPDEEPVKTVVPNEMAGVSGERLADLRLIRWSSSIIAAPYCSPILRRSKRSSHWKPAQRSIYGFGHRKCMLSFKV